MQGRNFFNSETIMCIKYGLLVCVIFLNCNEVQSNSLWPPKLLGKLNPEDKAKPLPPPTKNVGASDVNPCIKNGCKIFGPLCEHGKCTESVSLNSCQWMCRCEPGWRGYLCEERDTVQIPILTTKASTTTTTSTTTAAPTTAAPTTVTVTDTVTPTSTTPTATSTSTVQPITSTSMSTTNEASEAVTSSSTTTTAATAATTDARETTTDVPTTDSSTIVQTDTSATTGKTTKGPTTDTTRVSATSTESYKTTTEQSATSTTDAIKPQTTSTMPAGTASVTPSPSESQFKGSSTLKSTESVTSTQLASSTKSTVPVKVENLPRFAAQTQRKETAEKIYKTTTVPQQLDDTTSATVATDIPVITTTSEPLTETTTIIGSTTTEVQDTTRHVSDSGESTEQVPVVTAGEIVQPTQISSSLKPTTDASTTNMPSTTASETSTPSEMTVTTTKSYSSNAVPHISSESPSTAQTTSSTLEPTSALIMQSTTSVLSTKRPLLQNIKLKLPEAAKTPSREEVVLFPPKLSARKRKPFIAEMFHSKPKQTSQEEEVLFSETATNPSPEQKTTTTAKPVVGAKNMIHQSFLKDMKKMHSFFTNLGGTARNILPDNKKV